MASEFSFDVESQFDAQELRNAIDQVKREIATRYDFKGITAEVTLTDEDITLLVPDTMKLKAVQDMIFQKIVNRKLSPKILDLKDPEPAAGGNLKQLIKLIKALDQETCKVISKLIKDNFPKAKPSIQGTAVRVSSKDKDALQGVIAFLRAREDLKVPVQFTNYR
jgi:cyclic-di-GMP-binding protein